MSLNVDDIMRKTKSYWYEDGLAEILAGLFFTVISLLLLADWASPPDSPLGWIWTPGFMAVTLVWIAGGRRVIGWLKERITYPRTGYVAYHQQRRSAVLPRAVMAGVIGAAVSLVMVGALMYRQEIVRLVPLVMGVGICILLMRVAGEVGVPRFYALAGLSLLIGAALALYTADMGLSVALFYLALGLAVVAGGVVALWRYLHGARLEDSNDG